MVPELAEFVRPKRRPKLRGRDFSRTSYSAPPTVTRLTQAYNEPPPGNFWQRWRALIVVVTVLGGATAFSVSPFFKIRNVIVNGAPSQAAEVRLKTLVEAALQRRRFGILPQYNLIYLSPKQLTQVVSGELADSKVEFDRHWPNVLRLTLPGNAFVANWQVGEQNFIVDRRGILIQAVDDSTDNPQLVKVHEVGDVARKHGDVVADKQLIEFLGLLPAIWSSTLTQIELAYLEIETSNLPTVRAVTPGGWHVLISTANPLELQLTALKRLLEEKLQADQDKLLYIDVRFGSKLYYKMRP